MFQQAQLTQEKMDLFVKAPGVRRHGHLIQTLCGHITPDTIRQVQRLPATCHQECLSRKHQLRSCQSLDHRKHVPSPTKPNFSKAKHGRPAWCQAPGTWGCSRPLERASQRKQRHDPKQTNWWTAEKCPCILKRTFLMCSAGHRKAGLTCASKEYMGVKTCCPLKPDSTCSLCTCTLTFRFT